ncbi:MAG: N-acetylgalactosamine-6-sulfatase, partial [Candidatus Hydrogenedentes bacterium]|nr:N-acetylgalactosamine-6-sulfatase [Candidatus Hydrogenedentota bacterium]
FFPSLAQAAGAPLPEGVALDGFDAREILAGTKPSPRNEMFWVRRNFRGARVDNWKWVDMPGQGGLFDLSNDIGEEHDLSEEKPEVLQHLLSRFKAWETAMEAAEPRGPFRDY